MILIFLFLILGFVALIFGADILVAGATTLARKFRVSEAIIGLTIVAFGTSMPEFVVNVSAAVGGSGDIALANVIGSNIFNVLGILGCSALVIPLAVDADRRRIDIPVMILTAIIVLLLGKDFFLGNLGEVMQISRFDGVVLLLMFVAFMFYIVRQTLAQRATNDIVVSEADEKQAYWLVSLKIIGGLILLVIGGRVIVNNAVKIAEYFHVSERVIGLTIVSIGTSLPELATSVVAAFRRQVDIAVTNIVGSNIFNALFILGSTSIISPVPVQPDSIVDLALNLVLSLFLFAIVLGPKHRVGRIPGIIMLLGYVVYVIYLL